VAINGHAELPPRADPLQKKAEKLERAMLRKAAATAAAEAANRGKGGKPKAVQDKGKEKGKGSGAGAAAFAATVVKPAASSGNAVSGALEALLNGGFDPARRLYRTKVPTTRLVWWPCPVSTPSRWEPSSIHCLACFVSATLRAEASYDGHQRVQCSLWG
jgi:hypothetical protein